MAIKAKVWKKLSLQQKLTLLSLHKREGGCNLNRTVSFYWNGWYFETETYLIPMSILPTVATSRKIRRAVNRLLPVGHRCRGDVGNS